MFFNKNKDKNPEIEMDVPEFEDNNQKSQSSGGYDIPKFPNFDNEFGKIKEEIGRPAQAQPKINIPERKESISRPEISRTHTGNKPIFVKIENYKEAMDNIDKIKDLFRETDSLLDQIHRIRAEEDKELEKWHRDLDRVKDKLLNVDRKLFES